MNEAKTAFKPELLNRFDDIIVFRQLERDDVVKILSIELQQVSHRLEARGVSLELDAAAVDFLIDKGYAPDLGARPLRRAIEQHLEDPLAEALLHDTFAGPVTLKAVVTDNHLAFETLASGPVESAPPAVAPSGPAAKPDASPAAAGPAEPGPAEAGPPRRRPRARKTE